MLRVTLRAVGCARCHWCRYRSQGATEHRWGPQAPDRAWSSVAPLLIEHILRMW